MRSEEDSRFARFRSYIRVLAEGELGARFQKRIDASDLVQETFLQAWRDREKFRGKTDEDFAAWLRSILAHTVIKTVRHNRREMRDVFRERPIDISPDTSTRLLQSWLVASGETPSAEFRRLEGVEEMADAIAKLPEVQREAVVLHFLVGLSLKEVAEHMERTPGAAGVLIHRGLTAVRRTLEKKNDREA